MTHPGTEYTHAYLSEFADRYTILLGVAGSALHGINTDESDDDRMGVLCEPPRCVIGLDRFEQYQHRTAPAGERSRPGDVDVTVYGLRKWTRLAAQGNPTLLLLAFTPDSRVLLETDAGRDLRGMAEAFGSRSAANKFIGYLDSQRAKMLGLKSQRTNRPELIEQFGYDCKFAAHMVRLGWQGVELLTTGRITLPMPAPHREWLIECRAGRKSMREALDLAAGARAELVTLRDTSSLPEYPDWQGLNTWLQHTYVREWTRHGLLR